MSMYTFLGMGVVLLLLSIGIYYATRVLVARSMFKEPKKESRSYEPLYETPMPSKPESKPTNDKPVAKPSENPLTKFIEGWEEPKTTAKIKGEETGEGEEQVQDNPLTKFIEEWEEPKPLKKK